MRIMTCGLANIKEMICWLDWIREKITRTLIELEPQPSGSNSGENSDDYVARDVNDDWGENHNTALLPQGNYTKEE